MFFFLIFVFAEGFLGDVAIPVVEYESEIKAMKARESELDEIEKYKKEIHCEGLQIEAEGLTGTKFAKKVLRIPTDNGVGMEQGMNGGSTSDTGSRTSKMWVDERNSEQPRSVDDVPIIHEHTFDEYDNYTNTQNEIRIAQSSTAINKAKPITAKTSLKFVKSE